LLTLKGTPFLYNGEEIGMVDLELAELSQFRDTMALRQYERMTERMNVAPGEALRAVAATTRDRCRSPFQWCNAPNGGFSPTGRQTWLSVNPNFATGVNVADQERDPASLLCFYKQMLQLRRATPALIAGDYQALPLRDEQILAFLRSVPSGGQRCLVLLNFSAEERSYSLPPDFHRRRLLYTNRQHSPKSVTADRVTLAPFEIFLAEVS
jgi:alpha-glucosidase